MKYLNTPTVFAQKPSKVDREKGIIYDIVVVTEGEAKGHNINLNEKFLDDVVHLAAERPAGIKARFGHPNICATALGTYLGRFKNFREADSPLIPRGVRGVLADLHLDTSAKKSPKGNLYEYVLDMAETNPDMFGASIAFKQGKAIKEFTEVDGKQIEKQFATIKALYATDLVDSPAATDGLFQAFEHDDLASQVTLFLDEHPQVFELLTKKPEVLTEFLTKYKQYQKMNFSEEITKLKVWIKDNFTEKKSLGLSTENQAIFDALQTSFEQQLTELEKSISVVVPNQEETIANLTTNLDAASAKVKEFETANKELQTKFDKLTSEFNQLKANPTTTKSGDPKLNINPKDKDESGKILLSELPTQLRKKLKK
jgi:hypothetical protein